MAFQMITAPVGHKAIHLGFADDGFVQGVNIGVENIAQVEAFAMDLYNRIVTAAEQALVIPAEE